MHFCYSSFLLLLLKLWKAAVAKQRARVCVTPALPRKYYNASASMPRSPPRRCRSNLLSKRAGIVRHSNRSECNLSRSSTITRMATPLRTVKKKLYNTIKSTPPKTATSSERSQPPICRLSIAALNSQNYNINFI